jgi:signal transduction histidine kinase
MNPGRARLGAGLAVAGLLLQVLPVALAVVGGRLPRLDPPAVLLAAPLLTLGGVGLWWPVVAGRRRVALGLLLLAQFAALGVAVLPLARREPPDARARHDLAALAARAGTLAPTLTELTAAFDALASAASAREVAAADPFTALQRLAAGWPRRGSAAARFPLGLALWQDGERVAWDAGAAPLAVTPALARAATDGAAGVIERDRDAWTWRRFRRIAVTPVGSPSVLEMQVRLAPATVVDDGRDPAGGREIAAQAGGLARVVDSPAGEQPFVADDAANGLHAGVDLPLPDPDEAGRALWLRLTLAAPSRAVQTHQTAARRLLLWLLILTVGFVAWGAARGGVPLALMAAVGARLLLARADAVRWVQPAFPGGALPALPGDPASLLDPAYFATPTLGGGLASSADAVLTALLAAGVAVLIARRLARAGPADAVATGAPRPAGPWRAVAWGLLAAGGLLLLRALVITVAENANPRLIGLKAPYRSLSFWALHLVLLLGAGAWLTLLHAGARRLARAGGRRADLVAILLSAGAVAVGVPGLELVMRALLPLLALLIWVTGRARGPALAAAGESYPASQRLALLAAAVVIVVWNYAALAGAYGRTEVAWLERKGDDIVLPQQEWTRFLLGDALSGMADAEPGVSALTGRGAPPPSGVWRDWPAYELWRRSALGDLGLPCLVELIDPYGERESLFASGFFRDFRYEVGERGAWRTVVSPEDGGLIPAGLRTQTERRRYPSGEEWILRGEVPRAGGGGWIRIELSVQSRRIRTLLARLEGTPAPTGASGYVPRAEVDRAILLLRGDDRGWLDAGPGLFPDADETAVTASLKAGRARWATVRAGGLAYRCLWKRVPEPTAGSPGEGFLLGLERPRLADRLLDVSRLVLLDLLLAACLVAPLLPLRLARRPRPLLGFQQRFLAAVLVLGLLPLLLAGLFMDRLTVQGLAAGAREQTRDGIEAAVAQLQGLLSEQARALAGSEYIADLLASRLAGQRPLGPFSVRQAMVFTGDGELLLDETLSDLDAEEARRFLAVARAAPLILMESGDVLYLGLVVPVDLSEFAPSPGRAAPADSLADEHRDGFFFYRQRVDSGLMNGLAEIIQGEVALSAGGATVLASHPERLFAGAVPALLPPGTARQIAFYPGSPALAAAPGTRLSYTASMALPALAVDSGAPGLRRRPVPAALSVTFPARERDLAGQRERMALFLVGLAALIFLAVAALALALAWKIFGPVRVLVTATRSLATGDFAAPLPESGGDEIGLLSAAYRSMRDDLAQAQRTVAERERFLAAILEHVPVGVAVFGADGGVTALNPAAGAIADAFAGGAGAGAGREGRVRALLASLRERLGDAPQGEAELRAFDGRRIVRGRVAPLRLPDGRSDTLLVCEDVTEFLDNKRLALNSELARQVAHEIKNPLTPIQLSVQFLEQAYRDRAPELDGIVRDTVRQVLEQVALLRAIATEFSLLGKPGALPVAPLDLPEAARQVTARYRAGGAAGAGPRVTIDPDAVPPVLADAEAIGKVLGNLMENSLQAVGEPSRLELRVRWEIGEREVTLLWEDNGPGVPPDVAGRLFELYFSTKSQGTGLGLAICRSLLDRMGGRIALADRVDGGGAVAAVTLPRAPQGSDRAGTGGEEVGEDERRS